MGPPPFTPAGGLPILGREGRMVVLSLVLGLSEQDDFANIPDLQNPGTQQNQNAQGDKRYEHGRGLRQRQQQQRRRHREATCLSRPRLLDEVVVSSADAGVGETLQLVLSPDHLSGVPWVYEGTILGPFWIKPAPQHACPGLEQAQPPGPHLLACLPLLPLHLSSLSPFPTRNPRFSGGW